MDQYLNSERSSDRNIRIFINYAYEDHRAATRLYEDLKEAGLSPWFDRKSLLAGQNWEIEIHKALKNSRYFITLFSSASVRKLGFTRREFRFAMAALDSIPESDIFVIPVRLDDCEIPYQKLERYQYIDLFPSWKDGLQKIVKSISIGIENKPLEYDSGFNTLRDSEWFELLESIYEQKISPCIGPEAHVPWIPQNQQIASEWAEEYGYPLEERNNLSRVSQFLAIDNRDDLFPKKYLADIFVIYGHQTFL